MNGSLQGYFMILQRCWSQISWRPAAVGSDAQYLGCCCFWVPRDILLYDVICHIWSPFKTCIQIIYTFYYTMFNTYQSFFMCMFTLHVFFLFTFEYAPIIFHRYHIIRDAVYVATLCYIILVRMHIWVFPYMVVPPISTPKWSFLVGKPMGLLGKPTILGNAHMVHLFVRSCQSVIQWGCKGHLPTNAWCVSWPASLAWNPSGGVEKPVEGRCQKTVMFEDFRLKSWFIDVFGSVFGIVYT